MESIKVHPNYKNYGYNMLDNQIYFIPKHRIVKQHSNHTGYLFVTVGEHKFHKTMCAHRFICECCNTIIPHGYEIDHINKTKSDNSISNLRCITMEENRKNRDHTNVNIATAVGCKAQRFIKAININTLDYKCFKSKSQCGKHFGISAAMVYLICAHKNKAKTANTYLGKYSFEYIDEYDVKNLIIIPDPRIGRVYEKSKAI